MFDTVLIANRGVIACRIIRTLRRMGVRSVAVFSDADAGSRHVQEADLAIRIGPPPAAESYLDVEAILAAARASGAQAIHPGYGFLSENVGFAEACAAAGLVFVGPTPQNLRDFGLKHTARALAVEADVPLMPGTPLLADAQTALEAAERIGFPVMLKATAGGGGIGMRVCEDATAVRDGFAAVARLGAGNFGDGGVFVERFLPRARHIEVQVFGDGAGRVLALGERDCSLQRRNQKVIEETPAPHLPAATRDAMGEAALRLMRRARYASAGTVEFLYDEPGDRFYFLEVNTRLQVEHGVTEQVTGIDLVEWMLRLAAGEADVLDRWDGRASGAAIQARLYAEDPTENFRPSAGRLIEVAFPADARVETWVERGSEITSFYDPMLAKLIVRAPDRAGAVTAMQAALDACRLAGVETNLDWLRTVARDPAFVEGQVSTSALAAIAYRPDGLRVIQGGAATTLQDYPGRQGYWAVGVPPSGPMDALAFRLGNRLLGNPEGATGLEITAAGPTLRFEAQVEFCLAGARFEASLDGAPVLPYAPMLARAGQTLKVGRVQGGGLRAYLLVAGGFAAPDFLGSEAAFTLGEFGGHATRPVAAGDLLRLQRAPTQARRAPPRQPPAIERDWTLRVLYGPHGAPDFFTPDDIAQFVQAQWVVHYNSNRTGVRLTGPKPMWARTDGGEAGLHPSNIHDNPYAIGAVDFTGDMPILLGPDGPSLGGFVCPFVVIAADLWKLGQLAPGDRLRFEPMADAAAAAAAADQDAYVAAEPPGPALHPTAFGPAPESPILHALEAQGERPRVVYRRQGDRNILVEYGPLILDLDLRVRVHALMLALQALAPEGMGEITPGIRSLQVQFDPRRLKPDALMDMLVAAEAELGDLSGFEIESRIVHLPLSWNDPAVRQTIDKYAQAVRDDAPWQPDNIEFIRRINGLDNAEAVRQIVFDASYLVLGLGDVYLGAPVATPLDPRHRLVTTKYNPARTWTPPNVVGIGGAYMCIYGMEGPGGYQLFGRTIQVWNSWRQTDAFVDGKPWLLRFFDQIRFFPVTADELAAWRLDFPLGRRALKIEPARFRLSDHRAFLADHAADITAFEARRRSAFDAERERWARSGEFDRVADLSAETTADGPDAALDVPEGAELLEAPFGGSVWRLLVAPGDAVAAGQVVAILEAMKMESEVRSSSPGVVARVYVAERQAVNAGAPLIALSPAPAGPAQPPPAVSPAPP